MKSLAVGTERRSRVAFYMQDKFSSPNPTITQVVTGPVDGGNQAPPSVTGYRFGGMYVADNAITEKPEPGSRELGRARGLMAVASTDGSGLYLSFHVVFTDGEYKGSSIAIMALDSVLHEQKELPVVGGTGCFRLARGFAIMKRHSSDAATRDLVLHIEAFLLHYDQVEIDN